MVNATGQFSDSVAKYFGVGDDYTILPFKGIYYAVDKNSSLKLNGLIYPVPDLSVPFLGIHSVKSIQGDLYFGPTAVPAFGRENYHGLEGASIGDTASISYYLMKKYIDNSQGFRNFLYQESHRFIKKNFWESAKKLIPSLTMSDLVKSSKVGIRAQLLDKRSNEFVMDFLIEKNHNTLHVLNAVSPAFTSSFSFAKHIIKEVSNG